MSHPQQRNDWLDLCRAIAVIGVVVCHGVEIFPEPIFRPIQILSGIFGVDIFFCLSGFLIGSIVIDTVRDFDGDIRKIRSFMVRRWLRTIPNYYVWLLINLAIFHLLAWPIDARHRLWSYPVFMQSLLWAHPPFFPEAWSLAVEEIFYLLLPLTFIATWAVVRRWFLALVATMIGLLALSMSLRFHVALHTNNWAEDIAKVALLRLDSLMWGVALVLIHKIVLRDRPRALRIIAVSLLCFLPSAGWIIAQGQLWLNTHFIGKFWVFTMSSLGICGAISLGLNLRLPRLLKPSVKLVARWSYSMYLANMPTTYLIRYFLGAGASTLERITLFEVYALVTMIFAGITYNLVERPVLRWRDRHVRGTAPRVESSISATTS